MTALAQRQTRGRQNYHAGLAAEGIVERDYERRGGRIEARRWRGRYGGEIDLIFRDGDQLVFIEVKKSRSHDTAAYRVSPRQMARICSSALEFIGNEPKGQRTQMRIDVALVDGSGAVKVIENVSQWC